MAWTPDDFDAFKSAVDAGRTYYELASAFGATTDQVKHYLTDARKAGLMPTRDGNTAPQIQQPAAPENANIGVRLIKYLKESPTAHTIVELANRFELSPRRVQTLVEQLQAQAYLVDCDGDTVKCATPTKQSSLSLPFDLAAGNRIKFGVVSDTHLCSQYERLDILEALYDEFEEQGIEHVFLPGNYVDGEARFNKSDLHTHGFENQVGYFVNNFPQREGIHTHFVDGDDHEGWWTQREAISVGTRVEQTARGRGREDLHFLGYMERDVLIPTEHGGTIIKVKHPGGGTAYAESYTSQKEVESYSFDEYPHICMLGHFHKMNYFMINGCHVVQCACTEEQTPWMRKRRIRAALGGLIINCVVDDYGDVLSFAPEFLTPKRLRIDKRRWTHKLYVPGSAEVAV